MVRAATASMCLGTYVLRTYEVVVAAPLISGVRLPAPAFSKQRPTPGLRQSHQTRWFAPWAEHEGLKEMWLFQRETMTG